MIGIGPFGKSSTSLLDTIFLNNYKKYIIYDPVFNERNRANISPQFEIGNIYVVSSTQIPENSGNFIGGIQEFSGNYNPEEALNVYRYEYAIIASRDLGIITSWAQAEYAIIAFREDLFISYDGWFRAMQQMGVIQEFV